MASPGPADPLAVLKSRQYLGLLVVCAVLGVPISAIAYFYLKLSAWLQAWLYTTLPDELGFVSPPMWWPAPVLAFGGLLVASAITYLPGRGGESPVEGFKTGGIAPANAVAGIAVASLATLGTGFVLGPEAPLIALGGGPVRRHRTVGAPRDARAGDRHRRSGRQLRGDRDPAGFTDRRSVLAHGGGGARRLDVGGRSSSRSAGQRHRGADLRRTGRLDRIRNLLPGRAPPHRRTEPRRRAVRMGCRHRHRGGLDRLDDPPIRRTASGRARPSPHDPYARHRTGDRRTGDRLRAGDVQAEFRRAVLRADRADHL